MSCFSYAIDMNIKRYKNLLATSVDETERKTILSLLAEENAKVAAIPLSEPDKTGGFRRAP